MTVLTSPSPAWRKSVRLMRVVCPCALVLVIVVGVLAWSSGLYNLVAINAFLAGVNSMLTWINWRLFSL